MVEGMHKKVTEGENEREKKGEIDSYMEGWMD